MKAAFIRVLAILAVMLSLPAMAGSFNGTIVSVDARTNGIVYVTMSGTTGHGACSSSPSALWIVKDETSVAGKNQINLLVGAWFAGRTVTVYGVNTCTRLTGVEDIDEVTVF